AANPRRSALCSRQSCDRPHQDQPYFSPPIDIVDVMLPYANSDCQRAFLQRRTNTSCAQVHACIDETRGERTIRSPPRTTILSHSLRLLFASAVATLPGAALGDI